MLRALTLHLLERCVDVCLARCREFRLLGGGACLHREEELRDERDGESCAGEDEAEYPLSCGERAGGREVAAEGDDEELHDEREAHDPDEEHVVENPAEDVELVLQLPAVDLVEDLAEHEQVERDRRHLHRPLRDAKERRAVGHHEDIECELEARLADDVPLHERGDERRVLAVRLALQELGLRVVRGERERSHGVHDEVDPQHLHGGEHALPVLVEDRPEEGECDGDDVDGQLELEELADAVEDVPAPRHRLDDGGEVVVHEDDVRRLLRDLGAGDAHREADVGALQRGGVVRPIARDGDDVA